MKLATRFLILSLSATLLSGCGGSSNSPATPDSPPPPPPLVANADSATADNGDAVLINVLANDSGAAATSLGVSAVGTPASGTVTLSNGQLSYTPREAFVGLDRFSYTLIDGSGRSATGEVQVTSRVQLTLSGSTNIASPTVTITVGSSRTEVRGDATGGFSFLLSSSDSNAVILIESRGEGPQVFRHYAVLLGTPARMIAYHRALGRVPLTPINVARLLVDTLTTAEYGMLRELAPAADLLDAGKLARLRAFVDAEALLERKYLLDLAVGRPTEQTELDSLALAANPVALRPLFALTDDIHFLIDRDFQLTLRTRYTPVALLGNQATWIDSDREQGRSRLFRVARWSGTRLSSHERVRLDGAGQVLARLPITAQVEVLSGGSSTGVLLRGSVAAPLGLEEQCDVSQQQCTVQRRATSVFLTPFLDHYLRLSRDGEGPGSSPPGAAFFNARLTTLVEGYNRASPPATALLSLCPGCGTEGGTWTTDRTLFGSDARFEMRSDYRLAATPRIAGRWMPVAQTGLLLNTDADAAMYQLDWAAEAPGRGLAVIERTVAGGSPLLVLSEWAELPATMPTLTSAPARCDPALDGYALGRGLRPGFLPGERFRLLPNGQFVRGTDPALAGEPQPGDLWTLSNGELSLIRGSQSEATRFYPLDVLADGRRLWQEIRIQLPAAPTVPDNLPVEPARESVPRMLVCSF